MKRTWCGLRRHHEALRPDAVAEETDAFQERPLRDAAGGEDDALAGSQVLRAVDARRGRRSPCGASGRRRTGVVSTSRPWISPFRQRMAAAVSTPSGAPPIPITAWTPVPSTAAEMPAERSPSPISRIRAPALRMSAISVSWRGRSSTIDHEVVDVAVERSRDAPSGCPRPAPRCRPCPARGPGTTSLSM